MRQGKRLVNRFVFTVFIGGMLAVPFYLPGPTGKPLLQAQDFIPELPGMNTLSFMANQKFNALKQSFGALISTVQQQGSSTGAGISVYRWQDEEGNWHFSDAAPETPSLSVSSVKVDARNFFPLSLPDSSLEESSPEPSSAAAAGTPMSSNPLEYLKQYPDMLKKAEAARDLMNARNHHQQDILDSL